MSAIFIFLSVNKLRMRHGCFMLTHTVFSRIIVRVGVLYFVRCLRLHYEGIDGKRNVIPV